MEGKKCIIFCTLFDPNGYDTFVHFSFQGLDSILASSWGFILATWQLRKSPNMHILVQCEGFFFPLLLWVLSISMEQKSTLEKKARCEPASHWQLVSRLLRRKASKVTEQDVRKKIFRIKEKMRKTMEIAWALITRYGHLQHFVLCQNFS